MHLRHGPYLLPGLESWSFGLGLVCCIRTQGYGGEQNATQYYPAEVQ